MARSDRIPTMTDIAVAMPEFKGFGADLHSCKTMTCACQKSSKLTPSRKKLLWFLEVGEFFRKLYLKCLTQSRNILKILLLQFVTTMKFHHPFWRNTFHGMSIYDAASRQ